MLGGIGAAANAIRAGAAFVEIGGDAAPVKEAMASVKESVLNMASGLVKAQAILTGFLTSMFYGGYKSIEVAASMEEQQAKFNVVFKHNIEGMNEWRDKFSEIMKLSRLDMTRWLATAQDTFVPLGFAREDAEQLSKLLVRLGLDLAAFNEMDPEDTQRNLISGLIGEPEALRKYGIIINQAALEQELFNMGITEGVDAASEQEKMLARLAIVLKSTTDAQGQALRESDSWTSGMRSLTAQLQELRREIGEQLMPAIKPYVQWLTDVVIATRLWLNANPEVVQSLLKIFVSLAKLAAMVGLLFLIGFIFGTWPGRIMGVGLVLMWLLDWLGLVDTGFKDLTDSVYLFGDSLTGHVETGILKMKLVWLEFQQWLTNLFFNLGEPVEAWANRTVKAILGKNGIFGAFLALEQGFNNLMKILGLMDQDAETTADAYIRKMEGYFDGRMQEAKGQRDAYSAIIQGEIDGIKAQLDEKAKNRADNKDNPNSFGNILDNVLNGVGSTLEGLGDYKMPDIKPAPKENLNPKKDEVTGFFGFQNIAEQLGAGMGVYSIDKQQLDALKGIKDAITSLPKQIGDELDQKSMDSDIPTAGETTRDRLGVFNIPLLPGAGVSKLVNPEGGSGQENVKTAFNVDSGNSSDMRRLLEVTEKIEQNTRNQVPTFG